MIGAPLLLFLFLQLAPSTALSNVDRLDSQFKHISGNDIISGEILQFPVKDQKQTQVLVFLSSKCPCSASYLPELTVLANEFKEPRFQFIGVHSNQDEAPEIARDYFKKANLPFPVIQDSDGTYAELFGAVATPHAFVIRSDGEIIFRGCVGDSRSGDRARNHYLRTILEKVQKGEPVALQEARPLGCSIRTKKRGWK